MSIFKSLFQQYYQLQPKHIQISIKTGLILFISGNLFFLVLKISVSTNTLNIYFSLLSSLATIFAAFVAFILFQDYKSQKQAEVLSQLAEKKLLAFKKIGKKISLFNSFFCTIYFRINNEMSFIKNKNIICKEIKIFLENKDIINICINYNTLPLFHSIIQLLSSNDKLTLLKSCSFLEDYYLFLIKLQAYLEQTPFHIIQQEQKFYQKKIEFYYQTLNNNLDIVFKMLIEKSIFK